MRNALLTLILLAILAVDTAANPAGFFGGYVGARRLAASAEPWTPADSSPRLWLDASETDTMTFSGTEILTWTNLGTQAAQATPQTSTRRADLLTDPVTGKEGAFFDGSVDYYRWSLGSVVKAAPALTIAVVVRHSAIGAQRAYFIERVAASTTARARLYRLSSGAYQWEGRWDDGATVYSVATDTGIATTNITSIVGIMNSANNSLAIYINGTLSATKSGAVAFADADSATAPSIAYSLSGSDFFDGYLYEMIIFPTALTGSDLQGLHDYIKSKWGTP